MNKRRLIDTKEASELLGVTQRTVSVWLKANKLPGFRMGRGRKSEWRLNREDLIEYLRQQANPLQREFEEERWKKHLQFIENLPEDDEPLTPEEKIKLDEAEKDIAEGKTIPWEQVKEELGL